MPFHIIQRFRPEYSPTNITQYRSDRTGMTVVVVDREGPKVNGYFALATEIHDDSGAPHTLEHLCFMGSKSYPYKGVLDKLATRAYSNTNAWTATDHTAYTLDTAGWAGFAQILPVYLEHILVPTLTDAGCYTEVHHIDPQGNDAGVVYSEMQGVQNNQAELMDLESRRLTYPPSVGFRYETGGMMEQLRILTAEQIRQFHKDMYQPRNLCLILIGKVDHTDMRRILDEFETSIASPSLSTPFKRPWTESPATPALPKTLVETVEFPEEDESMGEIMITFFGPPFDDSLLCCALVVILRYLASTSASVLDNTLVEKEQLASGVYYSNEMRPETQIQFSISGVSTADLAAVEQRFHSILKETASQPLDMTYLRECIQVERRQIKFQAENSAQFFADPIIRDFMFGSRDGATLRRDLEKLDEYTTLEQWSDERWRVWLRTWFVDAHHVSILGHPSSKLSERIKNDEEARITGRRDELGETGLQNLAEKLVKAQMENDREIPKHLLEGFPIPSPESITFISTTTARSGSARQMGELDTAAQHVIDQDRCDSSLFLHFEDIPSNFVSITILMGTETLPLHLRPLLTLFMENFFTTPIERNGKVVEFEQVVMELERDTVAYGIFSGQSLGNSETVLLSIQAETQEYERAIQWLRQLMFNALFDVTRLTATVARLLAEIPDEKRSGSSMVAAVDDMIISGANSIVRARNTLVRAVHLKALKRLLVLDPQNIIAQLTEIRHHLFQQENFRTLVIADTQKLQQPVSSWRSLFPQRTEKALMPLQSRWSRMSDQGREPGKIAYLLPLPTIDSSYLTADAKGPNSHVDADIPALMVAGAYLNAVEGPLWTAVRGTGLAYGTSFRQHTDAGQVSIDIYRSPDAFKAFTASKMVITEIATGKVPLDDLALAGTVSSLVLEFANKEATLSNAAAVSFVRQVIRGQPRNWPSILLDKIRQVTPDEIRQVMRSVILPLFDPEKSILITACAPIMQAGLERDLGSLGYRPEVQSLAHFQDDYGLGDGLEPDSSDSDMSEEAQESEDDSDE